MIRRSLPAGFTLLALLASAPSTASAQGWTLDAYAGRAVYDPVAASVGTSNGALGLRYGGASGGWFYLSAAAPLGSEDPLWGAAGLGRRWTRGAGRYSAGVDVGAHGHGYRDPSSSEFGSGATLEALPFVAVQGGAARLELRSGLTQYLSSFSGETQSRTLHDSGARLVVGGRWPLELAGEARFVRAEEDDYPYAGASASVDHARGEVRASVGRWFSDALPDLSWSAGASFRLAPRVEVWASVGEESSDPIYWNAPRQSWNIGVSHRLGRRAETPAPIPPVIAAGRVTIRIPASAAKATPFIAGDFTEWKPVPMVRAGDFWTVNLAVRPGFYHYAFRTAEGKWFVPESVPGRRDDGFGGYTAVLVVP